MWVKKLAIEFVWEINGWRMKFLFRSTTKIGQDESADEESLTIGRCRRTGDLTAKVHTYSRRLVPAQPPQYHNPSGKSQCSTFFLLYLAGLGTFNSITKVLNLWFNVFGIAQIENTDISSLWLTLNLMTGNNQCLQNLQTHALSMRILLLVEAVTGLWICNGDLPVGLQSPHSDSR